MASDGQSKCNKQLTISFTLPISCQICLGKVKQPVLCPNLHVFCSLCLEIWLNRNSQCPACRVDIGPDNPVKHIIGGHVEDEECDKKSSPDLRRARFDLLYQEYEDQLEQVNKENVILTTENNIIKAQLRDAENKNNSQTKNGNCKNTKDKVPPLSAHLLQASDGPSLLMLTKKLQEAQRLYSTIKAHMSELKQENCKLKDENVQLTRENEILRLEIAQRSPKKFGRYTVATLETRISEQEKEIRQLKKALECSDSYIEELQRMQEGLHGDGGNKARFHINLEPKYSGDESCSFKDLLPKNKHCKVLFGKVGHEEANEASKKSDVSAVTSSKSSHKKHSFTITSLINQDVSEIDAKSQLKQPNCNSRNSCTMSTRAEAYTTSHHRTESQIASGMEAPEPKFLSKETDIEVSQERNPKKVHFSINEKSDDVSSFDLDIPSPVSSSPASDSNSSMNKELVSSPQKSATQAAPSWSCENQTSTVDTTISNLDGKSYTLLPEKSVSLDSKLFTIGGLSVLQTGNSKKLKQLQEKARKIKSAPAARKTKQVFEDASDNSHLSVPDVAMGDVVDTLNSTSEITECGDDLDISMTPEFTQCLHLMTQAERKIQHPPSTALSTTALPFSTYSAGSSTKIFPVYQIPNPSNAPSTSSSNYKLTSVPQYFPASSKGISPFDTIPSSWEQQFYSSLRVNPYKHTVLNEFHNSPVSRNHNPHNDNKSRACTGHKEEVDPAVKSVARMDFKFSDPLKVCSSLFGKPYNPYTFSDHTVSDFGGNFLNPTSVCLSAPGISTASSSFPATTSRCNLTASTSSVQNFAASTTSGYDFAASKCEPCNDSSTLASTGLSSPSELSSPDAQNSKKCCSSSSSHLDLPSKSESIHSYDAALSNSLNNSELEWPEDS